jgi:hypothetical protein
MSARRNPDVRLTEDQLRSLNCGEAVTVLVPPDNPENKFRHVKIGTQQ